MARWARVGRWVLSGLLLATVATGAARADPFYDTRGDLSAVGNGAVLRSRPITALAGVVPIPVSAWQIAYRTVDAHEEPTAAMTTVLVPRTPWTGPRPRPLLSYQEATDSVDQRCAMSHVLRDGIAAPPGPGQLDVLTSIEAALARGWAVAAPDHEGPRSEFFAGPMAAHAVLDGIRAALRFEPAGLSPDAPVAVMGYSGGALASGWAAEQQPRYAPELRLVGA
ncbi:lipase family protein, partial [Nocardia gipuzkoensis]